MNRDQAQQQVQLRTKPLSYNGLRALAKDLGLNAGRHPTRIDLINIIEPHLIDKLLRLNNQADLPETITPPVPVENNNPPIIDLQEKIRNLEEPAAYPMFIRAKMTLSDGENPIERTERYFSKISNKTDFENYKNNVQNRFFSYEFTKDYPNHVATNLDFIIDNIYEQQYLQRVRDFPTENCVINLLRHYDTSRADKIYKHFPSLKPTEDNPNPSLDQAQLEKIGKNRDIKLKFNVYSALGAHTNKKWMTLGTVSKGKAINVKVECEHATMIPSKLKPTNIEYHDTLEIPTATNVSEIRRETNGTPIFYTTIDENQITIHKTFKPSTVTNNEDDDQDLQYARVTTTEQLLYRLFKSKYNLTSHPDPIIRNITKHAENFIGMRLLSHIPANAIETDHNKNYIAYEGLPEYMGFPTNTLIPTTEANAINPAFVVTTVRNAPEYFYHFYGIKDLYVLPRPTYDFIKKRSTTTPTYVLDHPQEFQKISIVHFALNHAINAVPEHELKKFRNSLIGRTITGGMKENRQITVAYSNENERSQIIHECQQEGYNYTASLAQDGFITAEIPNTSPGLYNFHSFILSYAAVHMMRKWESLTNDHKATIHAFNVDALVFSTPNAIPTESSTVLGQWKYEKPKKYYQNLTPDPQPRYYRQETIPTPNHPSHPTKNTVITGPGGIGKSHPFLNDPHHHQIILTPTKALRDAHKVHFPNTVTAQKYFQFNQKDDKYVDKMRMQQRLPHKHTVLIIDEFTMFTEKEWELMLKRSQGSLIIALGDFEQIRSERDEDSPISRQWFKQHGFDFKNIERDPNNKARHEYEYGVQLDSLRYKSYETQQKIVRQLFETTKDPLGYNPLTATIIVGNHVAANYYNALIKDRFDVIPVRHKKTNKITNKPITNPKIWWERSKQTDQIPDNYAYEPAFARTADSIQGRTITSNTIIVDVKTLTRHGTLYTAVTRTPTPHTTMLI